MTRPSDRPPPWPPQTPLVTVDPPVAILLFGPNCAGKSTVGREVARRIALCAFIEVDELRYMVQGGLIAASGGRPPGEDVVGYARQCRLAVENAVRLANGFASAGFSSVIEGLDDEDRPPSEWLPRVIPGPIANVALVCGEAALTGRLCERGWRAAIGHTLEVDCWYRDHAGDFDGVINTGDCPPDVCADRILELPMLRDTAR